jgi:hypothetical protein
MAAGSASETEHHLTVACDLGLVDETIASRLIDRVIEVRRMLFGLHRALVAAETNEVKPPIPSGETEADDRDSELETD